MMFAYGSSKQTTQQKEFVSKSFKCCFVGFSSSPKSFLRNTFWGPRYLASQMMSLTRVQTNFASDKGLRAEPLKIASFVSPSPKKFVSQYFSGTPFFWQTLHHCSKHCCYIISALADTSLVHGTNITSTGNMAVSFFAFFKFIKSFLLIREKSVFKKHFSSCPSACDFARI